MNKDLFSDGSLKIMEIEPAHNFIFNKDNKQIGKLDWTTGKFKFSGKAQKSAKVFFDWLKDYIDVYIEYELKSRECSKANNG